ncbi:MAG TPA: urease accessory protein UreE [Burkholderiaceae bacterium]|nr:urease accessory protein UreE [Burkholderiaceae bacterium]
MLRCIRLLETPPAASDLAAARVLTLPYDERVKSRLAAMTADGTAVAVLLPRGTVLRDGSVLVAESGEYVVVRASAQPLTRVTANSPLQLLRAVYHLANRHVHAQLAVDHVLIERDPVLERMLVALGARVEHVELPFDPEAGAYDSHGHAHGHHHHEEIDDVSATVGEQLSIEAHRTRGQPT